MSNDTALIKEWANPDGIFGDEDYSPDKILETVCVATSTRAEDIVSERRYRSIMRARHLYWACLRRYCGLSYPAIAELTNRHHTTIMDGVAKVPANVIEACGRLYKERNEQ